MKSRWAWVVLSLAVAMTVLRAALAAHLGLGDDEAYYWDWSRHLQLSYYDHPAMVAWLIRVGCAIFGENSFGVRMMGLLCNGAAGVFIWLLARRMFNERVAWTSVFLYVFAPIFTVGGILMVPDAPLALAWTAFTYLLWRLLNEPSRRNFWIWAGVVLGLGLLSKYTMILVALSGVVLFAFQDAKELARPRFWMAVAIAFVLALPIVIWNASYDWPTLQYHLHDRQTGGGGANFTRWMQYFVSQAVCLGPALFVTCVATLVHGFRKWSDTRWRFIALVSFPPLAIFTVQALFAEFKPHWPAPAYPLLLIGAAAWWHEWASKALRVSVAALVLIFFALVNVVFHAAAISPIAPKIARAFNAPWDPKFDPTNDLFGWDQAIEAARMIEYKENSEGRAVFLSSSRYQLVAQLAFASQRDAFRVSPGRDYYTFLYDKDTYEHMKGWSSVFITDNRFERDPRTDNRFDSCEEQSPVVVKREEEEARTFNVWLCRGFRGLD